MSELSFSTKERKWKMSFCFSNLGRFGETSFNEKYKKLTISALKFNRISIARMVNKKQNKGRVSCLTSSYQHDDNIALCFSNRKNFGSNRSVSFRTEERIRTEEKNRRVQIVCGFLFWMKSEGRQQKKRNKFNSESHMCVSTLLFKMSDKQVLFAYVISAFERNGMMYWVAASSVWAPTESVCVCVWSGRVFKLIDGRTQTLGLKSGVAWPKRSFDAVPSCVPDCGRWMISNWLHRLSNKPYFIHRFQCASTMIAFKRGVERPNHGIGICNKTEKIYEQSGNVRTKPFVEQSGRPSRFAVVCVCVFQKAGVRNSSPRWSIFAGINDREQSIRGSIRVNGVWCRHVRARSGQFNVD